MGEQRTTSANQPWRGWGPIVVLPAAALLLTPPDWPRWLFMWLLCGALFAGCKWLTWRRTPAPDAPPWRHLGYLIAWPGLDAKAFLRRGPLPAAERPRTSEWTGALAMCLAGALLLWALLPRVADQPALLRGWVGMVGIAQLLHFGFFRMLSCAWRSVGVDARPLMNAPLAARGISEFWGRRWNTAFRDLTHRFLFRPLTARFGPRWALIAGFVFSGLIHELAISVPAGAGYGGPTLFFGLQVPALLLERSQAGQRLGLGRGWRGWLFAAVVLIVPAGLLFHRPFVVDVVLPFLQAVGA